MDSEVLLKKAIELIEDRKAVDLVVYDVRGRSILADYYLICAGNSSTQIRAIINNLSKGLHELGGSPRAIEGKPESLWVLMDYRDLLIHVFHPETRQYYNLESLMDGAPCIYPPAVAAVDKATKASPKVATAAIFETPAGASPQRAERVVKTRRRRTAP